MARHRRRGPLLNEAGRHAAFGLALAALAILLIWSRLS